jgi:hypothetical protein
MSIPSVQGSSDGATARNHSSPHFSHPLYCIGAMIRPDGVALRRPPHRTIQYVCGLGRAPYPTGPCFVPQMKTAPLRDEKV